VLLKCSKLAASAFLDQSHDAPLQDVRAVDCCDAGIAVPVSRHPDFKRIVCLCQHPENSRLFAHCELCDNHNMIMIWKWVGTSADERQPAVCAEVCFMPPQKWRIYQICFLPKQQRGPADEHLVAVLGRMCDCHWLAISIYAVTRDGKFRLHSIKKVMVNLLDETLQKDGCEISHFGVAQSGRTLILAGSRLLRLYSISMAAKNVELLDLEGAHDCESHILNRDTAATTVTAVCPLPMEPGTREGLLDWIWLGLSNGEMFGILVEETARGRLSVHSSSGRFRRNTHCQGLPIRAIIPIHEPAQDHSLYYSLTMRRRDISPSMVFSIGADGKLLRTERSSHQWVPAGEWTLPLSNNAKRYGFGAASSALLPPVLLLADEGTQRLIAVDERNPSHISEGFTCPLS